VTAEAARLRLELRADGDVDRAAVGAEALRERGEQRCTPVALRHQPLQPAGQGDGQLGGAHGARH
jgi:hypothetical protein